MEPMPCWPGRVKMNLSCLALKSLFGPQRKNGRDTRLAAPGPLDSYQPKAPAPLAGPQEQAEREG